LGAGRFAIASAAPFAQATRGICARSELDSAYLMAGIRFQKLIAVRAIYNLRLCRFFRGLPCIRHDGA